MRYVLVALMLLGSVSSSNAGKWVSAANLTCWRTYCVFDNPTSLGSNVFVDDSGNPAYAVPITPVAAGILKPLRGDGNTASTISCDVQVHQLNATSSYLEIAVDKLRKCSPR